MYENALLILFVIFDLRVYGRQHKYKLAGAGLHPLQDILSSRLSEALGNELPPA